MLPLIPPASGGPGDDVSTSQPRRIHILTFRVRAEPLSRCERRAKHFTPSMWPDWTDQYRYHLDNGPTWWPDWTDTEYATVPLTAADILPARNPRTEGGTS